MRDLTKLSLVPSFNQCNYKDRIEHNQINFPYIDYRMPNKDSEEHIAFGKERMVWDEYPCFFIETLRTRCIFGMEKDVDLQAEVIAEVSMCKIKDYGNGYVTPVVYRSKKLPPLCHGRMKKRLINKLVGVGRVYYLGTEQSVLYKAKGGIYEFEGAVIDYVGIFTSLQDFYKALRYVYHDL